MYDPVDNFHQKELGFNLKKKGEFREAKQRLKNAIFLDDKEDKSVNSALEAIDKEVPGVDTEGN
jgi:hypothetical protein